MRCAANQKSTDRSNKQTSTKSICAPFANHHHLHLILNLKGHKIRGFADNLQVNQLERCSLHNERLVLNLFEALPALDQSAKAGFLPNSSE